MRFGPFEDLGCSSSRSIAGLLSNQGEKSINFHFIMVPFEEKVLKYGTPEPRWGWLAD